MKYNIANIKVADRKRDLGDITQLVESIKSIGLLNPVTLSRAGTLIAGYHRLEACKVLGWREIEANVVDLDELRAEMAEIDENLIRNELHWTDRDEHLKRRKEIYEALHPETKPGVAQAIGMNKSLGHNVTEIISTTPAPTFAQDTAAKTGVTDRTIRASIQRATAFAPEQREVLKRIDAKPTEATKLASKPEPFRAAIIEAIVEGKADTIKGAELVLKKEEAEAQVQAAPTKPRITHASWQTWLPQQEPCDLLLTDPPYATDIEDIQDFAFDWLPLALSKVKSTGRAYVCIGAYPHELQAYLNVPVPSHLRLLNVLVWTCENTLGPSPTDAYKLNWQAVLYYIGLNAPRLTPKDMMEQLSVQKIDAPDGRLGNRYHTWQKPDELAERFIRHSTKPGDTVMDCFSGTGTFMLAAHRLGRVARGCDRSLEMLRIAETRGCEIEYAHEG